MSAATFDDSYDIGTVSRWGASLAVIAALHVGGALAILTWRAAVEPYQPPPAAVMIDLAPLPQAQEAPPTDLPKGPQVQDFLPPPEPFDPEPIIIPPEPAPVPKPEVAVPVQEKPKPKPPEPKPKPKPVERREPPKQERKPPAEAATAPQAAEAPPAERTAAPAEGAPSTAASNAVPTWRSLVAARLERYKRYPQAAKMRGQQGIAHLQFRIDRQGNVLSSRIVKGSGYERLDEETLALIQRANPLPPPPAEFADNQLEFTIPIVFSLR